MKRVKMSFLFHQRIWQLLTLEVLLCFSLLFLTSPGQAAENIAVLDLIAKNGLSQAEASTLTDRVRSLVMQQGQYQIMERENIERLLKEQGFQSTQLCDNTNCSVEIGRLLAVRKIMTGSVSKLGNLYAINLRIIDVQSGQVLKDTYEDCICSLETVLTRSVPNVVNKILESVQLSGSLQIIPEKPPTLVLPETGLPIRRIKPHLFYLEGGVPLPSLLALAYSTFSFNNVRWASLSYLFHINEYFALGGQLGLEGLLSTVNPYAQLNSRFYFNPDPLAGFVEIGLGGYSTSFSPVVSGKLGIEQRLDNNWSLGASFGTVASLTHPRLELTLEGYLGLAF